MSEEVEKVTSDKPKNPGRQEWGRKLGKMQKELKAKKLNTAQEAQSPPAASMSPAWHHSILKWEYVTAVVGLIVGVAALYYQKKSYEDARKQNISVLLVDTRREAVNMSTAFSDF